eukprot:6175703-Pleurochrysis_carterae.AAC.1
MSQPPFARFGPQFAMIRTVILRSANHARSSVIEQLLLGNETLLMVLAELTNHSTMSIAVLYYCTL